MTNPAVKIPILCYHRVHADDDPAAPAVVDGQYCGHVTQSVFRRQMKLLAENGFTTVTHRDIMNWICEGTELPAEKPVAIDFDDNRLNVFENALPMMREHGFKGTIFVISELAAGNLPDLMQFPAMDWNHLATLKNDGWTIGAHTATHAHLAKLYGTDGGPEKVEKELQTSSESIKKYLGIDAPNFAYPSGDWNEQVETVVKKYYRTARLWQNNFEQACFNTHRTDPYRLQTMNISMQISNRKFENILLSTGD